jgi:hypothetical protein
MLVSRRDNLSFWPGCSSCLHFWIWIPHRFWPRGSSLLAFENPLIQIVLYDQYELPGTGYEMPTLRDLPPEIANSVCEYIERQHLRNVRLLNRAFDSTAR